MLKMKIVIIGGGSVLWTPRLGCDLLLEPSLDGSEMCLVDIDPQTLAAFILKLEPQGPDLPIGIAYRDHIDRMIILLHRIHLLCEYYSTFVRIVQGGIPGC